MVGSVLFTKWVTLSSVTRNNRRFDAPSLGAFVPVLLLFPVSLVSLMVFWWPVRLVFGGPPYRLAAAAYLVAGLALLSRPIAQRFLIRLLGARRPTAAEQRHIEPLWQEVLLRTRLSRKRFVLVLTDSDELNAFASGGRLVVVTTGALQTLPGRELQGVLAHEIGHHLGLENYALTLGYWLSLPVVALARIGFYLQNVATAATAAFAASSPVLTALGGAVAGLLRLMSLAFEGSLRIWQAVGGLVSRHAEFKADEWAVRLGFGYELSAAMRRSWFEEPSANTLTRTDRLFGSHPPLRTRVAKIEALARLNRTPLPDDF